MTECTLFPASSSYPSSTTYPCGSANVMGGAVSLATRGMFGGGAANIATGGWVPDIAIQVASAFCRGIPWLAEVGYSTLVHQGLEAVIDLYNFGASPDIRGILTPTPSINTRQNTSDILRMVSEGSQSPVVSSSPINGILTSTSNTVNTTHATSSIKRRGSTITTRGLQSYTDTN